MIEKFSNSAREIIFRAADDARSDGSSRIEPRHLLRAIAQLHPELLERRVDPDFQALPHGEADERRVGLSERSKQVLRKAYAIALAQYREQRRERRADEIEPDLEYWRRLGQLTLPDRQSRFSRWLLRRGRRRFWEVEPRHLLAALQSDSNWP